MEVPRQSAYLHQWLMSEVNLSKVKKVETWEEVTLLTEIARRTLWDGMKDPGTDSLHGVPIPRIESLSLPSNPSYL